MPAKADCTFAPGVDKTEAV